MGEEVFDPTLIKRVAADLLAAVNADPTAEHASKHVVLGGFSVTLTRGKGTMALTLVNGQPIPQEGADAWAKAVGAAAPDWWRTQEGRRWRCDWTPDLSNP